MDRLHLLEKFAVLAVGEAGHDVVDFGEHAVEAVERRVGLAQHAIDIIALVR